MKKHLLTKTFLFLAFLIWANAGWAQYSGTGTFTKITSLTDLVDGYYVVANSGDGFAMNTTNAGSYFAHTAITPSGGVITDPATTIVWKIEKIGSDYTISNTVSTNTTYVSYTGSSNAAYAVVNPAVISDNEKWTITYATNFVVTNKDLNTRILQYNASSPRFACYTTAQQKFNLYKLPDTQAPIATFNPANAAIDVIPFKDITITFDEAIRNIDDSEITDANVASLLTLKETDASGANVAYTATIDATKKVITINPDANLANNQLYYVAIAAIEDASNNATTPSNITFTTIAAISPYITDVAISEVAPYYAGNDVTVTWTSANVDFVKIEAWVPSISAWEEMIASTDATDGSQIITIPANAMYSTAYKVRVSYFTTPAVNAESSTFTIIAVTNNLTTLKAMAAGDIVKYTGKATVTYTRNSSYNQKYIQDVNDAVLIYDATTAPGYITDTYAIGDGITNVQGKITLYNGLIELVPQATTGEKITDASNPIIIPEVRTIASLTAADQSKLVKIENYTFTAPTGNFVSSTNYAVSQLGTDFAVASFAFRTAFSESNYIGTAVPTTSISTIGIVAIFNTTVQYTPRNLADFLSSIATISSGVYTVAGFEISNIASSTSVATFKLNLTPATNATFEVYESNGTTIATTMATGNKVIVTAQDGITTATYNVTLNAPRTGNDITAYSIGAYVGVITGQVIDVEIGFADDLATVVSTFTLSDGASAAIVATPQVSGVTINDFTSGTLVYTVTAEDLTTKNWTVNVTRATVQSSENDIISYTVEGIDGTVDAGLHTVTLEVLYSTSLTALVATFELSPYASATVAATPQVSAITANDFTAPVVYTVTAEDASTQDWTVTITNAPASDDATLSDLTVDGTTVTGFASTTFTYNVVLPYGTIAVPAVVAVENNAFANAVVTPAANVTGTLAERTATVDVTAEDLTTTETYTIVFSVAPETGILIFSEIIEGTSSNRAFEIYNPNATAVDLSQYTVKQSHDGTGFGVDGIAYVLPLEGTLAANDVYVIANNGAVAGVLAVADTILVYSTSQGQKMASFTGDDGLGLFRNGVLVDVIGQESIGPWAVAGTAAATVDHTLIRKFGTTTGNTNWTASAGTDATNSEWIVEALDYITNIGLPTEEPNEAPVITGVTLDPTNPTTSDDVIVSATITDDNTAAVDIEAYLYWGIVDGEEDTELDFLQVGFTDVFSATIPASTETTIYYVIEAFDGELYSEEYGSYSITVGINNPDAIVSMNVFPNPSNGQFTLELNAQKAGTFNVEIVNISGQVVFEKQIVQDGIFKSAIDISNSAKGVYYIRINDGTSVNVQKIVIQ